MGSEMMQPRRIGRRAEAAIVVRMAQSLNENALRLPIFMGPLCGKFDPSRGELGQFGLVRLIGSVDTSR
jgi:hypothetical protein